MIVLKGKKILSWGQTLIEVLLGLSIASIILGALGSSIISSLRNAQFAKNQNLASHFASQGMEIIRQIRDRKDDFNLGNFAGTYCLPEDGELDPKPNCPLNVGTPASYSRKVTIAQGDPSSNCESDAYYYIVVSVSWWDNACGDFSPCHKANQASCLIKRKQTSL